MEKQLPIAPRKSNFKDMLFPRAFRVVAGTDYNGVSHELREKNRGTSFQLYEVILEENSAWDYLKGQIYPSLARYLKYKSMDPAVGKGVVISLFFMNHFYLIDYSDFVKVYCEMEGLSERDFRLRVITWLTNINP